MNITTHTLPTTTTTLPSAIKLPGKIKTQVNALLGERQSLESAGLLSANTKAIFMLTGPENIEIRFSKSSTTTPTLTPSKENLASLKAQRESTPKWEPAKRAALTKSINAMSKALA